MAKDNMQTTVFAGRGAPTEMFLVVRIMGNGSHQQYLQNNNGWESGTRNAKNHGSIEAAKAACKGDQFVAHCKGETVKYYYP